LPSLVSICRPSSGDIARDLSPAHHAVDCESNASEIDGATRRAGTSKTTPRVVLDDLLERPKQTTYRDRIAVIGALPASIDVRGSPGCFV
jgi:hypothetical protein